MLAAPLLAEEVAGDAAHGASGIGALGIDLSSIIAYLVTFAVLLLLLRAFAYKPVMGMLDQRAEKVRESLEQAERVRAESAAQQAALERSLDEGRQQAQAVLAEAREQAERYREQQRTAAEAEAAALVERAREEIRTERDAAIEQVRAGFGALAVDAAERIINRSLDASAHQDLIDEALASSESLRGQG